jgi:hypothetical protein
VEHRLVLAEKGRKMDKNANDRKEFNVDEASVPVDRTRELSWALFDEHIDDVEFAELEQILLSDKPARENYIRCAQLHADLASHFAIPPSDSKSSSAKKTPVLGFLTGGLPLTGIDSPTADDSKS